MSSRQRPKSKWVGEGGKHVYQEIVMYIRMHVKTTLYPYIYCRKLYKSSGKIDQVIVHKLHALIMRVLFHCELYLETI